MLKKLKSVVYKDLQGKNGTLTIYQNSATMEIKIDIQEEKVEDEFREFKKEINQKLFDLETNLLNAIRKNEEEKEEKKERDRVMEEATFEKTHLITCSEFNDFNF